MTILGPSLDWREDAFGHAEHPVNVAVDLYLGPEAPVGFEKNWIPTLAGKAWFPYFGPAVAMESNPELGITLHCYRQSF